MVWYLRGAGAVAIEAWEATKTSAGPTTRLPWVVVGATATAVGGGATEEVVWPGLDPPGGGGEERRTRGLKLCPPRVFTMARLENERRGWDGME